MILCSYIIVIKLHSQDTKKKCIRHPGPKLLCQSYYTLLLFVYYCCCCCIKLYSLLLLLLLLCDRTADVCDFRYSTICCRAHTSGTKLPTTGWPARPARTSYRPPRSHSTSAGTTPRRRCLPTDTRSRRPRGCLNTWCSLLRHTTWPR